MPSIMRATPSSPGPRITRAGSGKPEPSPWMGGVGAVRFISFGGERQRWWRGRLLCVALLLLLLPLVVDKKGKRGAAGRGCDRGMRRGGGKYLYQ